MVEYITHPLDGGFERIRRANEHLADLEQRVRDTFIQQADSIEIEFHSNPPGDIKDFHQPTQTFWTIQDGILIGEICHNFRAALDYLVFELAKLDSGAPQDGTQFPIVDEKENFPKAQSRWLKGVAAMIDHIDYPNFKDSVEDRSLHSAYVGVWCAMAGLQHPPPDIQRATNARSALRSKNTP